MDGALARCTAIVEAHSGKVLQYAGDSLLAVFGADEAREDDPERAVRAGLALLAEGRAARRRGRGAGTAMPASTSASACTPAACCWAAGSTPRAASAASPSTSPRAWSRPRRPARCASATTPTAMCAACSMSSRSRRSRSRAWTSPSSPTSCCAPSRAPSASPRAASKASRRAWSGATPSSALLQDAFERLYGERGLAAVTVVGRSRRRQEPAALRVRELGRGPARGASASSRAEPTRRPSASPMACCATSWPGGCRSPTATAWRSPSARSSTASRRCSSADDGADMAQAHAHLLGHLIGLDFGDSRHVGGIRDDGRQIRNRGFHAAAQMFRRIAASDGAPDRAAARRPALGRRRLAGLPEPPRARSTATCRCWCSA